MSSYFFLPNTSIFGAGCINDIGSQAARLGKKSYLLITDSFLAKSDIVNKIKTSLNAEGIELFVYDKVTPNPTLIAVNEAYEMYKTNNIGGLISLGGGSAHDCTKAVAILTANPGPIEQYVGVNMFPKKGCPVIAVNTTAGTASEITDCFLITNTETNTKLIFEGVNALVDVAIDDPELMLTLPTKLTSSTGMDALTHAVECYVSNFSFKLANILAVDAVKLIFKSLKRACDVPNDIEARDDMVVGQYLAGMAFGNGGVGVCHATAHSLGGLYNLPHGLLNAILLPHVMRFNATVAADKYAQLYDALANDDSDLTIEAKCNKFIDMVEELSSDIGTKIPLKELGVKEEDFDKLADKALQDSCCDTNPIYPTKEDIVNILKAAY